MPHTWTNFSNSLRALSSIVPLASISITERKDEKTRKAMDRIMAHMVINGIPGLSVAVSIDGKLVWKKGFGFANVETLARCTGDSVMRIASISKSITATLTAKLVDEQKIDIDRDITMYLPEFPTKTFNGERAEITLRRLLSHTAGIRHYNDHDNANTDTNEAHRNNNERRKEFLSNRCFYDTIEALGVFKNDDLVAEPGTKFAYSTYGYTVVGAVLEKVTGKTYHQLSTQMFQDLGMNNTQLDNNTKIIAERVNYYKRNMNNTLENCSEVNCSNKFAGGGILSNVTDLLIFGNAFLFSLQYQSPYSLIQQKTAREFLLKHSSVNDNISYGLGWFVENKAAKESSLERSEVPFFYHTGGAVGASSVILICPSKCRSDPPSGICIAILCNMQDVSLLKLALSIKNIFDGIL